MKGISCTGAWGSRILTGKPFVTAAVSKVFDMIEAYDLVGHVNEAAPYLDGKLKKLAEKYSVVKETRGKGLMRALELTVPVGPYINRALEKRASADFSRHKYYPFRSSAGGDGGRY